MVGTKGKLEAFVPAHQRGGESSKAPNFRVGLRKLPWVDGVLPPEPAKGGCLYDIRVEVTLSSVYFVGEVA